MENKFTPAFRFAVCSDAHIDGVDAPGYIRLKKAIDYSLAFSIGNKAYSNLDAFLVVGDITNKGTVEQFSAFKEIYDSATAKGLKLLCTVAKGHDSITMKKKSLPHYKSLTNQETDFHKVIGGYHFIGLSTCRSLPHKHYSPLQKIWLKNQLKKSASATPDKPVFVFHHEHVKNTVYGSSNFDGWGNRFFTGVFEKYPNVVDFSGHSHYPVNDPRSVWQGEFTAIGTGSLKYTELTVDDERKVHPPTCEDCSNFLIIEADKDSNLHIIGVDCLAGEILCEYYLMNPADKNNRDYTQEKQLSRSKAPEFSDNAQVSVTEENGNYSAVYPKALSTDGMPVFVYRAYVYDEKGNIISQGKTVPSYYLYEPEETVTTNLGKLKKGRYKIEVFAENCYKIKSEPIETKIEI
jgi:hypothetical protein